MKGFIYVLMVLAFGLVIYNLTQVDYSDPLSDDSALALIIIVVGLCAILLLAILRTSKRIQDVVKKKR